MQLIGISVFSATKNQPTCAKKEGSLLSTVDIHTKLTIGKRAKAEAVQFLGEHGVSLSKKVSYAVKQKSKDEFWMNPQTDKLNEVWELLLNNNIEHELIVMRIPPFTFKLKTANEKGLFVRADNPNRIDLNLNTETFKDRRSELDFMPYITHRIKYGSYGQSPPIA